MEGWTAAFARVPALLVAHVQVSLSAILLALIISTPLAIHAARHRGFASGILGFASLIQTIPALALLALFYPVLLGLSALLGDGIPALGFLPALMALTLYALLPILRNAVTGLTGVSPAAQEAADGLGMTRWQKLRLVEAPLAAPTIMAGIRTASVWTIGAATLSTTVGQPSLGDLIFAGLQTQNWTLVLAGCIASAGLAITVDLLLGQIESAIEQRQKWRGRIAATLLAFGLGAALIPSLLPKDEVITIGTKGFSEQYILARLIGSRLEEAGYTIAYRDGLGSAVLFRAVMEGHINVAVDYSGTVWTNEMKREDSAPTEEMLKDISGFVTDQGGQLMGALGFENAYAFAVRPEDANELGLSNLDDLARAAPAMTLGTDTEFLERPEWAKVKSVHDMRFAATRSFSPTFMYPALASGEVDAITAFSSDGRIAAEGFVILDDNLDAIPSYEAILLTSPKLATDSKALKALEPLVGAIDVETMRQANYMVDRESEKRTPAQAARWLDAQIRAKETK